MLLIPSIGVSSPDEKEQIIEKMANIEANSVACVNWPEDYPSKPVVSFKAAHNRTHLFLHFFVEENEILAATTQDNGPVWTDSCVEFFLSAGDPDVYYNLEVSCIGTALLGYRKLGETTVHGSKEIMDSIKRFPSLGSRPIEKNQGLFKWDILVAIPVEAYWKSGIKSFDGLKVRGNFYKCGDNLSIPHFLSWNPIKTEKPNFHVPQFFGDIHFQ